MRRVHHSDDNESGYAVILWVLKRLKAVFHAAMLDASL